MVQQFNAGKLTVKIYPDRVQLGQEAASVAATTLRYLLRHQEEVNIIFAAAPSQNEFLAALAKEKGIAWQQVNAFHMDEYIGLPAAATQRFGNFLQHRIFDLLDFKSVNYLNGEEADCIRYSHLLQSFPPDIVFMGIGENGHLAFNDPPVADFADPALVKVVALDAACRQQQVNDGCFSSLEAVPTHALTLTIPALMQAPYIYCMVPGPTKAQAVYNTIHQPMEPAFPSTILRTHSGAALFLDTQSSGLLAAQKV
jgi:glucosamine-6-phosphate deaminase